MNTTLEDLMEFLVQRSADSNNQKEINTLYGIKTVISEVFLEQEKKMVIEAYKDGIDEYVDVKIQSNSEKYYNNKFNKQ